MKTGPPQVHPVFGGRADEQHRIYAEGILQLPELMACSRPILGLFEGALLGSGE
jgi:hypothetical protein